MDGRNFSQLISMPLKTSSLLVKATLLLSSSLTVMAGATIAPSLPAMRDYFAATPNADYWVRLVLTVPALFIAIGAPFVGTLIDRFGRKPLLAFAVLLYGIAGTSGAVLNDIGMILVGRVLLGLSVAGIMTTATALIADYYIGAARAQFLGFQAGFMGLGGVVPIIGWFPGRCELATAIPDLSPGVAHLATRHTCFTRTQPHRSCPEFRNRSD